MIVKCYCGEREVCRYTLRDVAKKQGFNLDLKITHKV